MNIPLAKIIALLIHFRYGLLFPFVAIEGPIVTVIAGFFISTGIMNFWPVIAITVAADLASDTAYYFAGRYGGLRVIRRWGNLLKVEMTTVEQIEQHFKHHTGKTLIFGKLTLYVGVALLLAAGIARIPFRKFFWYNFIATVPKSLLFIIVGFYFGAFYVRINKYLDLAGILFLILSIVIIGVFIWVSKKYKKKYLSEEKE